MRNKNKALEQRFRHPSSGAGHRAGVIIGPERLEDRKVLSATLPTEETALVAWRGQQVLSQRDSYVVQMPQTNVAASQGLWDYASDTPGIRPGWSIRSLGLGGFEIQTPGASAAEVQAWSTEVGVVAIAPNSVLEKQAVLPRKVPNDPRFAARQQWALDNQGQPPLGTVAPFNPPFTADADIDAPEAWRIDPVNQNTGSRSIVVAIMDDGIDYTHPDLQRNIWQRPANVPSSLSGRFGFDVANRDVDIPERNYYATMPGDPNDIHGTAVAGIIGAKGNDNRGMTGVNWDVSLLAANIFRNGSRYSSNADFVEAANRLIRLRTEFGVNIAVVNASWMSIRGFDAPPPFGDNVMAGAVANLARAGILFVTAAGNGYDSLGNFGDFVGDLNDGDIVHGCPQVWPGNYYAFNPEVYGNVISVGASTPSDTLARFSNFSTTNVHIAAPGVNIWTTVPLKAVDLGATDYQSHASIQRDPRLPFQRFDPWSQTPAGITGGYAELSGTSMSAAYVSGVAALAAAEYRRWTGVLPGVSYLRGAVVDQADRVTTLTYTETTALKPDLLGRLTADPMHHPVHSIGGGRLNAYNTVKWVRENLPPKVTFANVSVLEGDSGTTDVVVTATLTQAVTSPLTVQVWTEAFPNEAAPGVDFALIPESAPRSVTIPAGQTTASLTLPALVFGDTAFERNERFWVKFGLPVNSEAWLATKAIAVTILNDDSSPAAPAATLDPAELIVTEGGGGSARPTIVNVPVTLDVPPVRAITVPYQVTSLANAGVPLPAGRVAATPGIDFVALAGSLRFAPGQTSAVVPVQIIGDTVAAGATGESLLESFAVRLLQPNPGVLKPGRFTKVITIQDDDTAPPPPPPPSLTPSLLQPGALSVVRGGVASIPVSLDIPVPSGYAVTIMFRTVTGGASGGTAVANADFRPVTLGRIVVQSGLSSGTISVPTFNNRNAVYPRRFFVEITGAMYTKVGSRNPADTIRINTSGLSPIEVTITG
jgi:subtilisin family serine protease